MKNSFLVPLAIIVAGGLIALAVFLGQGDTQNTSTSSGGAETLAINVTDINEDDHVLGNPDEAQIVFIEHSDPQCPFCATFHETMTDIQKEYSDTIAWVYRHFWPPRSLQQGSQPYHPLSGGAIEASECVADIAGNDTFWSYLTSIFDSGQLEEERLISQAVALGVDEEAFRTCIAGNQYDDFIEESFRNAIEAGAQGTPYTVALLKEEASDELEAFVAGIQAQNAGAIFLSDDLTKIALHGALPAQLIEQLITIVTTN